MLSAALAVRAGWVESLYDGLKYMHSERLVHCDFNLKNVLVLSGEPKIADLGSCKSFVGVDEVVIALDYKAMGFESLEDAAECGVTSITLNADQAFETDRKDFMKASYNLLCGKSGDLEVSADLSELKESIPQRFYEKAEDVFLCYQEADYSEAQCARLHDLVVEIKNDNKSLGLLP